MGQHPGTGRNAPATLPVDLPRARPRRLGGTSAFAVTAVAALNLVALPGFASTPATFDAAPEELSQFTAEEARRDPLAAQTRCRAFVTALYHRLRTQGANPAWDPAEGRAEPLEWVMEAYFTLPPATAGARAASTGADMTRAYLDAFGPAALASVLPDDPLYRNDKAICDGVLGLPDR